MPETIANLSKTPENYQTLEKHFTATGYVFNTEMTKVLLVHHKKLEKWMPAGGHVDPEEMPHDAVVREIFEETGIRASFVKTQKISPALAENSEWEMPNPYFTMLQLIPANTKQSEHFHYDFIYILVALEKDLVAMESEVAGLGWFTLEQVLELDTFSFTPVICKEFLSHS
jgi:8-oxo-dGTP pyrophosphatase MutT (NUDIX family)